MLVLVSDNQSEGEGEERPLGPKLSRFSVLFLLFHGGGTQARTALKAKLKDRATLVRTARLSRVPPCPRTARPPYRLPILGTAYPAYLSRQPTA